MSLLSPRDEIRASAFGQLTCPSCGESAGDLLGLDHCLVIVGTQGPHDLVEVECRDGERVECPEFGRMRAAVNIAAADYAWFRESARLRAQGFLA